jgi:hypothetical protein
MWLRAQRVCGVITVPIAGMDDEVTDEITGASKLQQRFSRVLRTGKWFWQGD